MNAIKKLEGSLVEVTITKTGEEVKGLREHVLTHFKDAKVDGFRQGKVPMDIIEKTYRDQINQEVLNHIINGEYPTIIKENEITPVDYFTVTKADITVDNVEIVFTVPVLPEVKVGNYKGVEVEKEELNVTDENINQEIDRMLESAGKLKEVENATAELQDTVNINFEGFVDGVAFDGGKAEGFDLTLGTKSFIDTFEDQIVGHKVGDEFDVNVTFPTEYHSKELAGKPSLFKVKVNSIKRLEKQELNDEFAKENGHESVEDMKAKIKENVTTREERRIEGNFIQQIVDSIVSTSEVEVPKSMVEKEINSKISEFSNQLKMQGISLEQYFQMTGQSLDSMKASVEETAATNVKADLVLSEISKLEKLTAEDKDIDDKIEEMAKMYNMETTNLLEEIKKAGNYEVFIDNLRYQIINEKTIELLKASAKIK